MTLSYKEQIRINEEFLDTLDLSKYLEKYEYVDDMYSAISDDYDDTDLLPKDFEGCIFNFMDDYEFARYLAKRYNLSLNEYYVSRYYLTKK